MSIQLTREQVVALHEHFIARQRELLALARTLVEAESPSGNEADSNAVVSLVAAAARAIGAIDSVERVRSEGFGEHLRIRAFSVPQGKNEGAPIVILGHTDT